MANLRMRIEIVTDSSMHIGSGSGFSSIIDEKSLAYMEGKHRWPIIMGHTIKGIVRDQFRDVSEVCGFNHESEVHLFGSEQQQGMLYFSPFLIHENLKEMLIQSNTTRNLFATRAGNQINRLTKVAQHDRLFSHEVVNGHLTWTGNIDGNVIVKKNITFKKNSYPLSLIHLLLAIKGVRKIGSRKSVGFGSCKTKIILLEWGGIILNEKEIIQLIDHGIPTLTAGGIR